MSSKQNVENIYKPNSSVLFLGICSLHKNITPGNKLYSVNDSIVSRIKDKKSVDALYNSRKKSLKETLEGNHIYNGILFHNQIFNENLKAGPDFRGSAQCSYLPAIERYTGRFYGGKTDDGRLFDLKEKYSGSKHHFLIISGLYGLLTPDEPIQLYESPLEDLPELQKLWKNDDNLTKILMSYVKSNNICLIIDMTGQRAYQDLINWSVLKSIPGLKILHAMSKVGPGPDQLKSFGIELYNSMFESSFEDLINLDDQMCNNDSSIIFRDLLSPPKDKNWPKEPTPLDEFSTTLFEFIENMPFNNEEVLSDLFEHKNAKKLLDEIIHGNVEWKLLINPNLRKDIDHYDNPYIKKLIYEKMYDLIKKYPVQRKNKEIRETGRIKEFILWRLRIGDYRLQFCTDEGKRIMYIFEFGKKQENEQTYDFSQFSLTKLRNLLLREEYTL